MMAGTKGRLPSGEASARKSSASQPSVISAICPEAVSPSLRCGSNEWSRLSRNNAVVAAGFQMRALRVRPRQTQPRAITNSARKPSRHVIFFPSA